jgi:hypothetical protein
MLRSDFLNHYCALCSIGNIRERQAKDNLIEKIGGIV